MILPGNAGAKIKKQFEIAIAHHSTGAFFEAETIYRNILASNPDHYDSLHCLGVMASQFGRHQDAVLFYKKAISLFALNPNFHFNHAVSQEALGLVEEAVTSYYKALEINPEYGGAYLNLGNCLYQVGKLDEALANYESALRCDESFSGAHSNSANILSELGRPEDALYHHQRAVPLRVAEGIGIGAGS